MTLTSPEGTESIPIVDVKRAVAEHGRFWSSIRVVLDTEDRKLARLDWLAAHCFANELDDVAKSRRLLAAHSESIKRVFDELKQLEDTPKYIRHSAYSEFVRSAEAATEELPADWPHLLSNLTEISMLATVRDMLDDPDRFRKAVNDGYVAAELKRSKTFFDTFELHPFTGEQRRAVVVDEDRNLLIAAAGSGKTSVLAAKVAWLLRRGDVSRKDLLVLAYSNDACKELKERVVKPAGVENAEGIKIQTFHGLGKSIIRDVEVKPPSLVRTATSDKAFHAELKSIIAGLVRTDSEFAECLCLWFQSYFAPYRTLHECEYYGEYWDYLRRHKIRSLNGEWVRSFEECEIANFLCLHSVRYDYRSVYQPEIRTPGRRKYRPSFYLPDEGVYIEVFGLSDSGEVAGFANKHWDGSLESVAWKRRKHAEHGTDLVEATTQERMSGTLLSNLREKLQRHGVVLSAIPHASVFEVLDRRYRTERHSRMDRLVGLIASFLRHFKGSGLSASVLDGRARKTKERARANVFGFLFGHVFMQYCDGLKASGQIDFDDMIVRAVKYVESGKTRIAYRYILIDEFQDMSHSRARLVKALLARVPDAQLFAVGDDWQAIMRFSGADVAIMRDFEAHFGHTERQYLQQTFRCTQAIANVATDFVLANKDQIEKTVTASGPASGMGVCITFPEPETPEQRDSGLGHGDRPIAVPDGPDRPPLVRAMETIAADARRAGGSSDVLLLGRYGVTVPGDEMVADLESRYPGLIFRTKTIHAAKGSSADYVVVFELGGGKWEFPSEIVDDPLLDLVLPAREQHENAEERRLMYVALTRARRLVFLLVDEAPPSPFVTELLGSRYDVSVYGRSPAEDPRCPVCVLGRINRRNTRASGRVFYDCSNRPYCDHGQPACPNPACGKALPTWEKEIFRCGACGASYRHCSACDGGWLLTREGQFGAFVGCANYPVCTFRDKLQA